MVQRVLFSSTKDERTNDLNLQSVMERFKRSVLDEKGRVRRLSDREAMEVASAAADGILKQVS